MCQTINDNLQRAGARIVGVSGTRVKESDVVASPPRHTQSQPSPPMPGRRSELQDDRMIIEMTTPAIFQSTDSGTKVLLFNGPRT